MQRPDPNEYDSYYGLYIRQVPGGEILEVLKTSLQETVSLLRDLPAPWARFRYAPGKWTLSEVVGHVIDTERVFSYRALAIARGDSANLPSMDQDVYAAHSNAGDRPLGSLLEELAAVRRASLALFAGLDPAVHTRAGRASGSPFTVRTFPWIVAGHEIHHRKVITERYLAPLGAGSAAGD